MIKQSKIKSEKNKKIFCIGLSRTGTTTVHNILEELGFKSVHFVESLLHNNWEVINKYDAFGDTPIPLIYKELDEKYPNSKFILTTRNKKKWLQSMKWMFLHGRVIWNWPTRLDVYHKDMYGCKRFERNTLGLAFDNYHKEVRKHFKHQPENFLEIQIEDGFDIHKICDFLQITYRPIQVIHSNKRRSAKSLQIIKYYTKLFVMYPIKKLFKKF